MPSCLIPIILLIIQVKFIPFVFEVILTRNIKEYQKILDILYEIMTL